MLKSSLKIIILTKDWQMCWAIITFPRMSFLSCAKPLMSCVINDSFSASLLGHRRSSRVKIDRENHNSLSQLRQPNRFSGVLCLWTVCWRLANRWNFVCSFYNWRDRDSREYFQPIQSLLLIFLFSSFLVIFIFATVAFREKQIHDSDRIT